MCNLDSNSEVDSNKSNSILINTADNGVPKIAVMPAAAPAAKRIFLSFAEVAENILRRPNHEPSEAPVAMIGPSAPNGPPVPMAKAEAIGFKKVIRLGIRLSP